MSDQHVEPSAAPDDDPGIIEVDVAAFLPPGVALAGPGEAPAAPPVDVEALTRIEAEFAAVDLALGALDDGTYGRCVVCAAPIDEALLAGDPVRRGCASHPQASPVVAEAATSEPTTA